VKRDILARLEQWKNKKARKPLILKGARQVGKTFALSRFGQSAFRRCHYVNFEMDNDLHAIFDKNLDPHRIIRDLEFYLDTPIETAFDLIIFDEIQACPRALTSLKYFNEQLPDAYICAAGSLLGIGLAEGSYPVGSVEYLDLYPMSFSEFLEGTGQKRIAAFLRDFSISEKIPHSVHTRLWEQWKQYLIVGGLPEIVKIYDERQPDLFKAIKSVRKRQAELIRDYLADMAKHSGKQNALHIERIWRNIPSQLAREHDGSAPKFRFKGVVPGVHAYSRLAGAIDWLEAAGLIIKVPIVNHADLPLFAYTRDNTFKLFCFDVGMLGALSGLPPKTILDYDYGSYKGYVAENYAARELIGTGAGNLYSWRERTAEVEFLIEFEGDILPLEIKSGWVTQAKSLAVFAEKYHPSYRTIFSAAKISIDHANRVHRYPIYLAGRFPLYRKS